MAAFTDQEYAARLEGARQVLRREGLAAAVCVAPEHLFYFSGYDAHTHFSEQALIFTAGDDEPTLVLRDSDIMSARESAWVKDIRYYHFGARRSESAAPLVAEVLRQKGVTSGTVGIELETYALTGGYLRRLEAALGDLRLADTTRTLGWLRVVKSPAEIAYVREAQSRSLAGVRAAYEAARPGISEIQWAGAIETVMRANNNDYSAMPTWVWSGPRTAACHAMPTERVVQPGDPAGFSMAGVSHRYHVSVYHCLHFGEPSDRYRRMYDICCEAQAAQVNAIRPGAPVAEAARAAAAVVERHGEIENMYVRWGYGVGIGYPPAWLEPLDVVQDSRDLFAPGMVFCLHVGLVFPDEGFGVVSGGDYLLNPDGIEALDTTGGAPERRELVVVR